jgi:hypothetical protein
MLYFLMLMASTLWLSSVLGDERMTLGISLLLMWVAPFLLRKKLGQRLGLVSAPAVDKAQPSRAASASLPATAQPRLAPATGGALEMPVAAGPARSGRRDGRKQRAHRRRR